MKNEILFLSEDHIERQWARLLGNDNLVIITERWNIYTDDWEHFSSAYFKVESIKKLAKWLDKKQDERQIETEREKRIRKNIVEKVDSEESFLGCRVLSIIEYKGEPYIILGFDHERQIVGLARWPHKIDVEHIEKYSSHLLVNLYLPFVEYKKCNVLFRW